MTHFKNKNFVYLMNTHIQKGIYCRLMYLRNISNILKKDTKQICFAVATLRVYETNSFCYLNVMVVLLFLISSRLKNITSKKVHLNDCTYTNDLIRSNFYRRVIKFDTFLYCKSEILFSFVIRSNISYIHITIKLIKKMKKTTTNIYII